MSGSQGWHRVAWAFLKPTPSKDYNNLGKRVRLQLYKPVNKKQMEAKAKSAPLASSNEPQVIKRSQKINRRPSLLKYFIYYKETILLAVPNG